MIFYYLIARSIKLNKDEDIYLEIGIDPEKTGYDPLIFSDKNDTKEDREVVEKKRKEYGITENEYKRIVNNLNNNSSKYKYDEEDNSEDMNKGDKKTIIAEEMEYEKETAFQKEISIINQRSVVKRYQNQRNTYNHHIDQINKNHFKIQRTYESNISNYQNQKNIDEYKANDQKNQLIEIEIQSESLLGKINKDKNHLRLWRYQDKYYCRVCEGIIVDNVEGGLTLKEIEKKFKNPTKIVEVNELITPKTENITQSKLYHFILLNHIPVIIDIKFNPKENEFFEEDGVLYQNTFKCTKYLKRRRYGY